MYHAYVKSYKRTRWLLQQSLRFSITPLAIDQNTLKQLEYEKIDALFTNPTPTGQKKIFIFCRIFQRKLEEKMRNEFLILFIVCTYCKLADNFIEHFLCIFFSFKDFTIILWKLNFKIVHYDYSSYFLPLLNFISYFMCISNGYISFHFLGIFFSFIFFCVLCVFSSLFLFIYKSIIFPLTKK